MTSTLSEDGSSGIQQELEEGEGGYPLEQAPDANSRHGDDTCLDAIEAELTKDVPTLLEVMNKSSSDVNYLESEAATAQQQYQQSLADWTSLVEDMRTRHGSTFDAVRPYFDAVHRARIASQRAQGITKAFSVATAQCSEATLELRKIEQRLEYGAHSVSLDSDQQEGLSRATVRALRCQQERDKCEHDYTTVLRDYEEAKAAAAKCRSRVGKTQIQRMVPCFRQLQQNQLQLDERRKHLSHMQERIRVAKNTYNQSMRTLDRVSTAVHHARKEYAERSSAKAEPEEKDQAACPEQDHPAVESGESYAFGDCLKTDGLADVAIIAGNSLPVPEVTSGELADESPFA